jgi:hypothetical protein
MGFIGNAIGSLVGGFGSGANQVQMHANAGQQQDNEARRARFLNMINQSQQRSEAGSPFYQAQVNNLGQLQQTASGMGPSVAQNLMNNAMDQNLAMQNSMAASARGNVNPALVQRQAMMNAGGFNQQIAAQAAQQRAAEALQARQLLAQAAAQGRGQDQAFQAQKDALAAQYEQMGLSAAMAQQQAELDAQRINAGIATGNMQSQNQLAGGVFTGLAGLGGLLATSDKRAKTDVKPARKDMQAFLDAVKAHKYRYKDPDADGHGEQFSVMAQELEKTPVGKAMVIEGPDGKKQVDYGRGFGALLAAQAHLNERLKQLESKRG